MAKGHQAIIISFYRLPLFQAGGNGKLLDLAGIQTALTGEYKADHANKGKQMDVRSAEHFNT